MTSTSFNIGMSQEKNSSRVLRPPGGGHSDIFGIKENETDIVTPKKKTQAPSSIAACFEQEADKVVKHETTNQQNGTNETDGVDENKAPEPEPVPIAEKKEESEAKAAPARRGRVPPGGYSTGFW